MPQPACAHVPTSDVGMPLSSAVIKPSSRCKPMPGQDRNIVSLLTEARVAPSVQASSNTYSP
eukprot:9928331-Alexandrium_andersonii.AAC.1